MNLPFNPHVLVVGGGAIGGVTAAHLRASGLDVTSLVTNEATRRALSEHGYRLRGHTTLKTVANPSLIGSTVRSPCPAATAPSSSAVAQLRRAG